MSGIVVNSASMSHGTTIGTRRRMMERGQALVRISIMGNEVSSVDADSGLASWLVWSHQNKSTAVYEAFSLDPVEPCVT